MKTAKFFISFLLAILFVGLSTADAQEKTYVKVYDSTQTFFATVTLDCPYEYQYEHILRDDNGVEFGRELRTGKIWIEMNAKSSKGELHVTCNQSIDGLTFERVNVGDEVFLHYSGEPGVYSWDWFDDVTGWIGGDPDEVISIGTTFVGPLAYDQSSTESGYSYFVEFQVVDPTVTTYDATFTVTDESTTDPISGASVTVTGVGTQSTNGSGQTTFTGLEDGTYSYEVSASGYVTENGSITVDGGNVTENVTMTAATQYWDAIFTVTAETGGAPIEGASVGVDGVDNLTTNASGQVTFVDLTDGVYTYTVDAPGYAAVSGNFTVAGDDVTVNVQLPDPYNVLFQVIGTNSSPVEGAEVYLDGYGTLVTNSAGEVEFEDVANGTYSYSVTADGYLLANGSVTVENGSITEIVSLSPTAIDDAVGSRISIYPNPVTTTLFIKDANEFESLSIYDVNGRVIYSSEVDGDITVDFTEFTNGIYFVKLTSNKKTYCCKISKQ